MAQASTWQVTYCLEHGPVWGVQATPMVCDQGIPGESATQTASENARDK